MHRACLVLLLILTASSAAPSAAQTPAPPEVSPAEPPPFTDWLEALRAEARGRGFSDALLDDAFRDLQPLERVIQSDRTQAELVPGFDRYFSSHVTRAVVRRGRTHRREHARVLRRIGARYGVPPQVLLAIWGMESRFGRATGRVPIFQALATLAWEPRRSDFFRSQLFDALTVVARGYIDVASMKGSWAGAMGQPQFMPSSYLAHAVDFDGDGHRDIWRSTPDALASIANYLHAYGWKAGSSWGREVTIADNAIARVRAAVPPRTDGCYAQRNMTERVPLSRWKALGVRAVNGRPLPASRTAAGLVVTGNRTFLVYDNYDAILGYNCAHYYALSVALLSDRIG